MRLLLLTTAIGLLLSAPASADGATGITTGDARVRQERVVRETELRRAQDTVKLEQTRTDADLARERQLQAIDNRRLEERVRALEASQGTR